MSSTPREKRKQARRQQILEAAIQAFSAKGYNKTNMEEIRAACGLSKGALYLYFSGKEALFAAVVLEIFAQFQAQCERLVAQRDRRAGTRLEELILSFTEMFDTSESSLGLYIDMFVQAWQTPAIRVALADAYTPYLQALTQLIEQGIAAGEFRPVNAEHAARGLIAALDGTFLQRLVDADAPLQPVLAAFARTYMEGLRV